MTHWSRVYVGTPYVPLGRARAGFDCWGYPYVAFAEQHGIEIERHEGEAVSDAERAEAEALFRGEFASAAWRDVPAGEEREWDLVWLKDPADFRPTHVGIVIKPGLMSHACRSAGMVAPDRYDAAPWSRLVMGFQRNRELEARQHEA